MHQKGVVHHDLKPANIMLQRSDNGKVAPVLIDFGLSNVMPSDGSKLSIRSGSMGYAAPELLGKRGHDT